MFERIETVTPPAVEPVTIDEIKRQLRIDDLADSSEQARIDADLMSKAAAARERCEAFTRRSLITRTLDVWFSEHDGIGIIDLPRGPIQSIVSVTVYDNDNAATVIDSTDYDLVGDTLIFRSLLPSHRNRLGIRIRIVAGYGNDPDDVPAAAREGILELIAHAYENRAGEPVSSKYEVEARLSGDLPQQVAAKWRMIRKTIA